MCREHKGVIAFASLFGVLQSVLWAVASVVFFLIYYCVVPAPEYKEKSDFFRVTLIKLYFEGPKCIPDGSYLGKFNEDYRNSITLLGRDAIMFVAIAYLFLDIVYGFFSLGLYLRRQKPKKNLFKVGWGITTLALCALDALMAYAFFLDSFTLMDYFSKTPGLDDLRFGSIPFIPLLLAFFSSRLLLVWLWNFFVGIYLLFSGLCGTPVTTKPKAQQISLNEGNETPGRVLEMVVEKAQEKPKEVQAETKLQAEDGNDSLSLISGNITSAFDTRLHPDVQYNSYSRSKEASTKFSNEDEMGREYYHRRWCYAPPSEVPFYPKSYPHYRHEWEANNEGYIHDENPTKEAVRSVDFEHNLKNFEMRLDKIKMPRPHPGKPVGIPVPPPLPPIGSCNC